MTAGVISGAVLQAARKTAGLTQEQLAEGLAVDVATVKGWESGRRPLGNVQAGRLVRVRRYLRAAGAHPELLGQVDTAIDADAFAAQAVAGDCSQLGSEVTTRAWHALLGWAVSGDPPAAAAAVMPRRALLGARDRAALFAAVRAAADEAAGNDGCLLRHQAYYLAADDDSGDGAAWLADARRAEGRRIRLDGTWTPGWSVGRSLAVAESRTGDPDPLGWFVRHHLDDPVCDEANLTYWAYWIGCYPEAAAGPEFMAERRLTVEQAARLLRHLATSLGPALPYAGLSVAAMDSLTRRWPGLLPCDRQLAAGLAASAAQLLDTPGQPASRDLLAALHRRAQDARRDEA